MESVLAVFAMAVDRWASVDAKFDVSFGSSSSLSEGLSVSRLASRADICDACFAKRSKRAAKKDVSRTEKPNNKGW